MALRARHRWVFQYVPEQDSTLHPIIVNPLASHWQSASCGKHAAAVEDLDNRPTCYASASFEASKVILAVDYACIEAQNC